MLPKDKFVVKRTHELLMLGKKYHDVMLGKYTPNDLRVVFFGLPLNVLHTLYLMNLAVIDTWGNKENWKRILNKPEPNSNDIRALREYEKFTKHSFILFFFSRIESLMRKSINFVSHGFNPTPNTSFYSIYTKYMNEIGVSKYIELFDIIRLIRNTIHNNGIYTNTNGKDRIIIWKEKEYKFYHGKGIDFMTPEVTFDLFEELIESINDIVNTPFFGQYSFIENKEY